jgi:hypothetical protein
VIACIKGLHPHSGWFFVSLVSYFRWEILA